MEEDEIYVMKQVDCVTYEKISVCLITFDPFGLSTLMYLP